MPGWLLVFALIVFVIFVLVSIRVLYKQWQVLRCLRDSAREQRFSLLRVQSAVNRTYLAVALEGFEQRFPQPEVDQLEVTQSPSGQWPSVVTL